jgi:endonuclease YncB( thermonuclease family)
MIHIRCIALGFLPFLLCVLTREVRAEIYRWIDPAGQVHFTDDVSQIPPEYREGAESRPSTAPSRMPPPPPDTSSPNRGSRASESPRPSRSGGKSAKVVAVLDGDTIVISGGEKVRYAGLNTPETHHPDKLPEYCGQEAFEANRRLVAGKSVRLEFGERRRDKYGRLLAYVYADNLFVNAELIRLGYGQVSTYKDNQRYHQEFSRLQQGAIAARRGLWGGCVDMRAAPLPAKPKRQGTLKSH